MKTQSTPTLAAVDQPRLVRLIEDLEFFLQDRDEEHKAEESDAAYARRCEADIIHRKLKRLKAKALQPNKKITDA